MDVRRRRAAGSGIRFESAGGEVFNSDVVTWGKLVPAKDLRVGIRLFKSEVGRAGNVLVPLPRNIGSLRTVAPKSAQPPQTTFDSNREARCCRSTHWVQACGTNLGWITDSVGGDVHQTGHHIGETWLQWRLRAVIEK